MAPGHGLDVEWGSGVHCKCGGELRVSPTYISDQYCVYGFECDQCGISGRWSDLAKGRKYKYEQKRGY